MYMTEHEALICRFLRAGSLLGHCVGVIRSAGPGEGGGGSGGVTDTGPVDSGRNKET